MEPLTCPRCSKDQTTQFTMDNQKWMECHACGFQVRMKFYKREFNIKENEKVLVVPPSQFKVIKKAVGTNSGIKVIKSKKI